MHALKKYSDTLYSRRKRNQAGGSKKATLLDEYDDSNRVRVRARESERKREKYILPHNGILVIFLYYIFGFIEITTI